MVYSEDMAGSDHMANRREKILFVIYLTVFFAVAATIALMQPHADTPPLYGNPPDEPARYLVSRYICRYGSLPNGFDPEVRIENYGISYAFYTMLPYIIQGFAMRFINLFTESELILLYTARFVNVLLGTGMAALVYGIGNRVFKDARFKWLFCLLTMYLPQSLFLHTYVNADSMALFSVALIAYALVRAYGEGFSVKNCLMLAVGIIICALSYYNAYGAILVSIILFLGYFVKKENGKLRYEGREMLLRGCLIAGLVLFGIGWYFIRNAILYDGDVLGLDSLIKCGLMYGNPPYAYTYAARGLPLLQMFQENPFFSGLLKSFIASYGSMAIYGNPWIYRFYKAVFAVGLLGGLLPRRKTGRDQWGRKLLIHANMLLCILIPLVLCVYYAYTMDYQYQGRYVMPGLLPFIYFVTVGLERWAGFDWLPRRVEAAKPLLKKLSGIACYVTIAAVVTALLWMLFGYALPVYREIGYVL